MSRMNGITRKKVYKLLIERDGKFCQFCGRTPNEMQLVIDHKDNDNSNNKPENHQLLCRRCNYIKNSRRPVDECVSENESGDQTEIQISRSKEPAFRNFVFHELNEHEEAPEYDIICAGAEDIQISTVTAKRYLDKMCSSRGLLRRITNVHTTIIKYKSNLEFT